MPDLCPTLSHFLKNRALRLLRFEKAEITTEALLGKESKGSGSGWSADFFNNLCALGAHNLKAKIASRKYSFETMVFKRKIYVEMRHIINDVHL